MTRLRVLLPGCPVEKALEAKTAACNEISERIADMTDTATTLIAKHSLCYAEECCDYDTPTLPQRRATDHR